MTSLHRVFIAINLPQGIKKALLEYKNKWPEFTDGPARWTAPENLHITLAFLGNKSDREIGTITQFLAQETPRHVPFSAEFKNIAYGPSPRNPRMIWAILKPSSHLSATQRAVESSLTSAGILLQEPRPFSPHITLARLNQWKLRHMEWEEIPAVDEPIDLSFEVSSVELMESTLKRNGAEYTALHRFPFKTSS